MAGTTLVSACSPRRAAHPPRSGPAPVTSGAPATTTSPASASAWVQPEVLLSHGGVLEVTLEAAPSMVPWRGGQRWALTYNGKTPGPTLRVRPGDRLRVTLSNRLDSPTNLHVHGLHVSPNAASDNVFVMIGPGEEHTYEYLIPADHPSGTFWYHPHHHGTVAEQVAAGMAGVIIIDDELDTLPPIANTTERIMVLSDPRIGTTSDVLRWSMMGMMQGRFGDGVLVNATPQPSLTVPAGTMERWRILNASASRYYPLRLDGARWWQLSSDGGRLAIPVDATGLVLAPGERAEVLVAVERAATMALTTTAWQSTPGMGGMGGMGGPPNRSGATETLLTVIGTGADTTAPAVNGPLNTIDSLADAHIGGTREFTFAMGGMMGGNGMSFTINGRSFDPERVDVEAALDTVEEWTITNATPMAHPFHLHVWPFQVIEASDQRTPPSGWKDVVDVPAGGWVRLRVAFRDFGGRAVYHCHILDHEDRGMMGVINVT